MRTIHEISERAELLLPFQVYSDTGARNIENPVDGLGVLHNMLMDTGMKMLAHNAYLGQGHTMGSILEVVGRIVNASEAWTLRCVCVVGENCPCKDLLDWLRDNFPTDGFPTSPFPTSHLPGTSGADPEVISQRIKDTHGETAAAYYRRLRHMAAEQSVHEGILALERRIQADAELDEIARMMLLSTASVARHSRFMALSMGHSHQTAAEPGQADVDGAALGGTLGGAAGPEGILPGALIGAVVFSIHAALT